MFDVFIKNGYTPQSGSLLFASQEIDTGTLIGTLPIAFNQYQTINNQVILQSTGNTEYT